MKDKDLRDMSRADLEDEVMLLRAQVKVLQNQVAAERRAFREWPQRAPVNPLDPCGTWPAIPNVTWGQDAGEASGVQDQTMTLTAKDAAVLALLSKGGVPRATKRVMLGRLHGEAKKIAENLTGGEPGSAQVRGAAEELRKFSASRQR